MKRLKLFLLFLIMMLAVALGGCGADSSPGDPPGGSGAGSEISAVTGDQVKENEENTGQTETGASSTPAASPSVQAENPAQPPIEPAQSGNLTQPGGGSGQPKQPTQAGNYVTLSINCQRAVDKGLHLKENFKDVVPADGIILAPTKVELKGNETVFEILKQVVREKKIHMEFEGSKGTPYIEGINNLYEFDGGPLSGWMYCVNKVYPNYGCGEYKLKVGDVIEWNYTCDLGKDLGQTWLGE